VLDAVFVNLMDCCVDGKVAVKERALTFVEPGGVGGVAPPGGVYVTLVGVAIVIPVRELNVAVLRFA
jgi:hypothetical protein